MKKDIMRKILNTSFLQRLYSINVLDNIVSNDEGFKDFRDEWEVLYSAYLKDLFKGIKSGEDDELDMFNRGLTDTLFTDFKDFDLSKINDEQVGASYLHFVNSKAYTYGTDEFKDKFGAEIDRVKRTCLSKIPKKTKEIDVIEM